ncbi:hypothetical protein [Actinoplanes sp. NPDC023714]|uniref:hypothetical protein n=1 Tax=Actinoplanes sp. NPDC023714 TaxID=3154322 RepID=UPI0033C21D7A
MTTSGISTAAAALRRLYFARAVFAFAWAGVTFAAAGELTGLTTVLFVIYPLADVAAAIVDARSSRATGSPVLLYVNVAVSSLAAIGLAVAGASGIPAMLRVWGAWAIVAGLVQLAVAVTRRRMGGQWPMIFSGGLSVLAGSSFYAAASAAEPALTNAVGYAIPGAVFFLVSAIRLGSAARSARSAGSAAGSAGSAARSAGSAAGSAGSAAGSAGSAAGSAGSAAKTSHSAAETSHSAAKGH